MQRQTDEFPRLPITESWRMEVRRKLDSMPGERMRMAAAMGVSRSLISKLIAGELQHSALVIPISRYLEIPIEMHGAADDTAELIALYHALTEDARMRVLRLARELDRPENQPKRTRTRKRRPE